MSPRRQVWETLANLLQRLEQGVSARLPLTENESANPLQSVEDELRKLGKAQFKANTLTERQFARWEEALEKLQVGQAQENELIEKLVRERTTAAQRDLLKTILPALDGLENAIAGGRQYLSRRDRAATLPHPTPPHPTPAQARRIAGRSGHAGRLAGWLAPGARSLVSRSGGRRRDTHSHSGTAV